MLFLSAWWLQFFFSFISDKNSRENTVIIVIINTSNTHQSSTLHIVCNLFFFKTVILRTFYSLGVSVFFSFEEKKRGKIENILLAREARCRVPSALFFLNFSIFPSKVEGSFATEKNSYFNQTKWFFGGWAAWMSPPDVLFYK